MPSAGFTITSADFMSVINGTPGSFHGATSTLTDIVLGCEDRCC